MTERVETLFDLTENNFSTLGVSSQLIYLSGLIVLLVVLMFSARGEPKSAVYIVLFFATSCPALVPDFKQTLKYTEKISMVSEQE